MIDFALFVFSVLWFFSANDDLLTRSYASHSYEPNGATVTEPVGIEIMCFSSDFPPLQWTPQS